jgi:hypothetical protein
LLLPWLAGISGLSLLTGGPCNATNIPAGPGSHTASGHPPCLVPSHAANPTRTPANRGASASTGTEQSLSGVSMRTEPDEARSYGSVYLGRQLCPHRHPFRAHRASERIGRPRRRGRRSRRGRPRPVLPPACASQPSHRARHGRMHAAVRLAAHQPGLSVLARQPRLARFAFQTFVPCAAGAVRARDDRATDSCGTPAARRHSQQARSSPHVAQALCHARRLPSWPSAPGTPSSPA